MDAFDTVFVSLIKEIFQLPHMMFLQTVQFESAETEFLNLVQSRFDAFVPANVPTRGVVKASAHWNSFLLCIDIGFKSFFSKDDDYTRIGKSLKMVGKDGEGCIKKILYQNNKSEPFYLDKFYWLTNYVSRILVLS